MHKRHGDRVIFFDPGDRVVFSIESCLARTGHRVSETSSLKTLLGMLSRAAFVSVTLSRRLSFASFARSYIAILLCVVARTPLVLFFSSDYVDLVESRIGRGLFYVLNKVFARRAHKVFLLRTRHHIAARYHFNEGKVGYFDNFFSSQELSCISPPDEIPPDVRGRRIFLYAGYNLWWHGLERFVGLFKELRRQHPECLLLVAGPRCASGFLRWFGRERRYWSWVQRLEGEHAVVFLDQLTREKLNWWIQQADFFVSGMDRETLQGRTELRTCLIEAMAHGAACVNVETPGLQEMGLFRDGENIIILSGDEEKDVEKLSFYMNMPCLRKRLGEQAKRTARLWFPVEPWVAKNVESLAAPARARVLPIAQGVQSFAGGRATAVCASAPADEVRQLLRQLAHPESTCYLIAPRKALPRFQGMEGVVPVAAGESWISCVGLGLRQILALRKKGIGKMFIPITKGSGEGYGNVSRVARAIGARSVCFVRGGRVVREVGSGPRALLEEVYRTVADTAVVVCASALGFFVVVFMEAKSSFLACRRRARTEFTRTEGLERKRVANE